MTVRSNPTNSIKPDTKRHILIDKKGILPSVVISFAWLSIKILINFNMDPNFDTHIINTLLIVLYNYLTIHQSIFFPFR